MLIYPAIDLKNNKCVRLLKGEMETAKVFADDPVSQALAFQNQGFKYLHVVDLNGAFAGKSIHTEVITNIVQAIDIPVQLGGGIRDMESIEKWLSIGISRVILGTIAIENFSLVEEACQKFPEKIAIGIDAKDDFIYVNGWAKKTDINVFDFVEKLSDAGVARVIYTDINKDGMMEGVNLDGVSKMIKKSKIKIIASGGVSNMDDIAALQKLNNGMVDGVISGRAVYEGKIISG